MRETIKVFLSVLAIIAGAMILYHLPHNINIQEYMPEAILGVVLPAAGITPFIVRSKKGSLGKYVIAIRFATQTRSTSKRGPGFEESPVATLSY